MKLILLILFFSCQSENTSYTSKSISIKGLAAKMKQTKRLSYSEARRLLFGKIHLESSSITDLYCNKRFSNKDIRSRYKIGKGKIPDHSIINTEHVWPKHRFFRKHRKTKKEYSIRETDLHILYPSATYLNEERGHKKFGEVIDKDFQTRNFTCSNAQVGPVSLKGRKVKKDYFEPPQVSKGNVARALFYYSIRYDEPIEEDEEYFLRKWDKQDPPDSIEKRRNNIIEKYQGNRNPFIDDVGLVDKINNF